MLLVRHFLRPVHGGYERHLLFCTAAGETVECLSVEEGDPGARRVVTILWSGISSEDELGMPSHAESMTLSDGAPLMRATPNEETGAVDEDD